MRTFSIHTVTRLIISFAALALAGLTAAPEAAALTVTPNTWNVIGLDSNTPAFGPNRFPVGAKVCGGTSGASAAATFTWDTGGTDNGTYIYLRPGSANPVTITFGADGCADAYFEVEVNKTSAAFDKTRRYYITAGGVPTSRPRELYVEHLISQSRNGIDTIKLNGVSIPAGGSMNLMVGNTYTIELYGHTAPGGYNQFEEFINFPNTIFQVLSVSTDYTANTSPYVSTTGHKYLYADACRWENDPNSPNYFSCWEDWKTGDSVTTTYTVKIIGGGGTSETLNSLLYDFSGSSFHYNADYSTGARIANIIDPTNVTISKNFSPDPTNAGGVSTLTFTLTNPNAGAVSGVNFTDSFPASPAAMVVGAAPNAATNGCGTPTFAPVAGAGSISFSNGTIAANSSCTVKVNVTAPATGTYTNTSANLFVGTLDTGRSATDTLTVDNASFPQPPLPSSCPGQEVELARWTMDASQGTGTPPLYFSKAADVATATASYTGASSISAAQGNPVNSWSAAGWAPNATGFPSAATAPYFSFVLDTSKYGGVRISSQHYIGSGEWASPGNNFLYMYSSADGGAFSTIYNATLPKGAWQTIGPVAAATTGTGTTTFRINAVGAKTLADPMYIDTIIFSGCKRPNPPTITKSFSPNPVAVGATSTLTFTVVNPNAGSALSGIAFTDTLPSGVTVTTGSAAQCGGTLTRTAPSTISFSGGTLAAAGSCTITATVTAATAGPHENVSGFVGAAESGKNTGSTGIATASLTAVSPPSISKLFAPNPILAGGTSVLTFTIANPNQNNALSGAAFTDILPVGLTVANATSSQCGGVNNVTTTAATRTIALTGGVLAAAGSCTVTVNVTAPATGTYSNTSGYVSHIINAATVNGNTASDTLTVSPASPQISLLKQVGPGATGPWTSFLALPTGGNVYYKFTVENPGDVDLTSVTVSDPALGGTVCNLGNLVKYAETSCTAGPVSAVSGLHINTATASGTYGGSPYTDQSSATYATTGLTFAKSATQNYFTAAGNVLNYSYVVTNSGSATLTGPVTVSDDKSTDESCPALSTVGDNDNYFDPAEAITCTATYTVAAADVTAKQVTNVASATVGGATSPPASKTVPLAPPDLTARKTNNTGGNIAAGGSFVWTLTVASSATAGTALFANGQALLQDDLPASGATYAAGSVTKAGATGTITCAIASNVLTCTANGAVMIPPLLQGTVAVTNGSTDVTGTGTAFTTQLTAGSVISISNASYTVASISSDTALALTANYAGANASGLAVPGSFSVPITVTVTAPGGSSLVNPKSGGICRAEPGEVVVESDDTNNDCADTVTVVSSSGLTITKSVQVYSDPINGIDTAFGGSGSAKPIPGAEVIYTVVVTNTGAGAIDNNTVVIADILPADTILCVANACSNPPVTFSCSVTPACGLTYDFAGDVSYFDAADGGHTPAPDAAGYDALARKVRINPKGVLNGAAGAPYPAFTLTFKAKVQ